MKSYLHLALLFTLLNSGTVLAQDTIRLSTPGTLNIVLSESNPASMTTLVVIGHLNASDFPAIKQATNLQYLNLKEVIAQGDTIPGYSFDNMQKLEKIIFPETVTEIGNYALAACSQLDSAILPDNLEKIGTGLFGWSGLSSITIPASVTEIGENAFASTKIDSIFITENIVSIAENAFYYCLNLEEIVVDADNSDFCDMDGILFSKDMSVMYQYPFGREDTEYSIPSTVKRLANYVFYNSNTIQTIVIPESVLSLSVYSVSSYKLKEITVHPSNPNFTSVNGVLFNKDGSLLIRYPAKIPENDYIVPETVIKIGELAFSNADSLKSVSMHNGITSIGKSAFSPSGIKEITIPAAVDTIQYGTFANCIKLQAVDLPDSLVCIGNWAFSNTRLTEVDLPFSIRHLGKYAFSYNKFTNLSVPALLDSIQEGAFMQCSNLEYVYLPAAVQYIGRDAFAFCSSLNEFQLTHMSPEEITLGTSVFRSVNLAECILKVPAGSSGIFSGAPVWQSFGNPEDYTPLLAVTQEYLNVPADGDDLEVNISSNIGWMVQNDASWISVSSAAGFGGGVLKISVAPNNTGADRKDTIYVSGMESLTESVIIIQAGLQSANKNIENPEISVYPVPVKDVLYITGAENRMAIITDIRGNIIVRRKLESTRESVDMSSFVPGMYLMSIEGYGKGFRVAKE